MSESACTACTAGQRSVSCVCSSGDWRIREHIQASGFKSKQKEVPEMARWESDGELHYRLNGIVFMLTCTHTKIKSTQAYIVYSRGGYPVI